MPFLWPPRPEKAIPRDLIPFYEKNGSIAQLKKNGTCTVIDVDKDGVPTFWNRHNELHKAWTAPNHIVEYFKQFPESVFVGELLHNKGPSVKDTLYLFDILIFKGNDLVGTKLKERLTMLYELPKSKGITFAKTYTKKFLQIFDSLDDPLDEGLVFKNPNARLKFCYKDGTNADWQAKCRKPTKNFGF
jgi:hypothetical protein